jgi:putative endonuclease
MDRRAATGRWGERAALRHLLRRGWLPVAERWRGGGGELDLVVRRRGILAACEVKVQTDAAPEGNPVAADQQGRIRRAVRAFLAAHPELLDHAVRIDLITVRRRGPFARVEHHRGALTEPPPGEGDQAMS